MMMSNLELDQLEVGYRAAIKQNPKSSNALYDLAYYLQNIKGNFTEAEDLYRKVLFMDGNHRQAMLQLGILRFKRKDYKKSEEILRCVTSLDSDNAEAFLHLALILMASKKDYEGAEDILRHAVQLEPLNPKVHFHLGRVLEHNKRYSEAEVGLCNIMLLKI